MNAPSNVNFLRALHADMVTGVKGYFALTVFFLIIFSVYLFLNPTFCKLENSCNFSKDLTVILGLISFLILQIVLSFFASRGRMWAIYGKFACFLLMALFVAIISIRSSYFFLVLAIPIIRSTRIYYGVLFKNAQET